MIATSATRRTTKGQGNGEGPGAWGRALGIASAGLRGAAGALRQWLRGATDGQKYESYLRHAAKCGDQPLTEQEFYLDDIKRKFSKPSRCC